MIDTLNGVVRPGTTLGTVDDDRVRLFAALCATLITMTEECDSHSRGG